MQKLFPCFWMLVDLYNCMYFSSKVQWWCTNVFTNQIISLQKGICTIYFLFIFAIVFALRALSITTGCFLMCDIKGGGSRGGIFSTKATITIVYNYIVYNCTACNSCPIMSESYNWIVFNSHLYICKYVWKNFFLTTSLHLPDYI